MVKKKIKKLIYFIPLIFVLAFNNFFIDVKTGHLFLIIVCITLILFALAIISKKKQIFISFTLLDILIITFYIYLAVSACITGNKSFLFFSIPYIIIVLTILRQKWDAYSINYCSVFGSLYIVFVTSISIIKQYLFGNWLQNAFTIFGFDNINLFANLIAILFGITLYGFLNCHRKSIKILHFVSILAIIYLLGISKSRSSIIATFLSACFMLVVHNRCMLVKLYKRLYFRIGSILLIVGILMLTMALILNYKTDSTSGRWFILKITMQTIKEKPLVGNGIGNFSRAYNDLQSDYFKSRPNDKKNIMLAANHPYGFNEFLQVTNEIGLIGLAQLAFILYYIVRVYIAELLTKTKKYPNIPFLGSTIAIFVVSAFSYPLREPLILYIILVIISVQLSQVYTKQLVHFTFRKKSFFSIVFISILMMYGIHVFSLFNDQLAWKKISIQPFNSKTQKKYSDLYKRLKYDPYFLYNYGSELSLSGFHKESIKILNEAKQKVNDSDVYTYLGNSYEALEDFEKAENSFLEAYYRMPVKFYPLYRLMLLYQKANKDDEALKTARQIIYKEVKIHSDIVDQIINEAQEYIIKHKGVLK